MVKAKKEKSVRLLPDGKPSPLDFDMFYPWACVEFESPIIPVINRTLQDKYLPAKVAGKPSSSVSNKSSNDYSVDSHHLHAHHVHTQTQCIVDAVYDSENNLVEINMKRTKLHVTLLKVLVICLPYQPKMRKLTLMGAEVTGQMVHILTCILQNSHITKIHITDTDILKQNFYELVETTSNLSQLLLCMCSINDDSLKPIMDHCKSNALLTILDLTSNNITDIGASHIRDMLRVNKSLYYLSLADNDIADAGCLEILRALVPFHLTADEILANRRRICDYLSHVIAAYMEGAKTQNSISPPPEMSRHEKRISRNKFDTSKQKSQKATFRTKAVSDEPKVAPDELTIRVNCGDESSFKETISRNGHVYGVGNRTLCHLNMSYNYIAYPALLRTLEVFNEQMKLMDKCERSGLSNVILDGNNLPVGGAPLPATGWARRGAGGEPGARTLRRLNKASSTNSNKLNQQSL